jgi:hypothetical protein
LEVDGILNQENPDLRQAGNLESTSGNLPDTVVLVGVLCVISLQWTAGTVESQPANTTRFKLVKPSWEKAFLPFRSLCTDTWKMQGSSRQVIALTVTLYRKQPLLSLHTVLLHLLCKDKLTKSLPSSIQTLQKRTTFTKETLVSSPNAKVVWNLNLFFLIQKDMS